MEKGSGLELRIWQETLAGNSEGMRYLGSEHRRMEAVEAHFPVSAAKPGGMKVWSFRFRGWGLESGSPIVSRE